MTRKTDFLCGIGAGMMAGAMAGGLLGRDSRKRLEKSLRKLGGTVEKAVDNMTEG